MQFAECRVVSGGRLTIGPQVSDRARFPWHRTSSTLTRRPARHQTVCSWHRSVADSIEAMTAIRRPHPDDTVLSSYVGVSGRSSAGNDRDDTVLHPRNGEAHGNQSSANPERFGRVGADKTEPRRTSRRRYTEDMARFEAGDRAVVGLVTAL